MRHEFHIDRKNAGSRLDIALCQLIEGLSRRQVRKFIDMGGAYVNNKRVRIASRELANGDTVRLEYDLRSLAKKEPIVLKPADICYEDATCIIINKPPGLAAQATRQQSISHAIPAVKDLLAKREQDAAGDGESGKPRAPRTKAIKLTLVHRLDMETSGLMIIAKSPRHAEGFAKMFKMRNVQKTYHALCFGHPAKEAFAIDNFLSPIASGTGMVKPCQKHFGRDAYTDFVVKRLFTQPLKGAYMICKPKTGRSHQIRSHLKTAGISIMGDKKYQSPSRPKDIPAEVADLLSSHHLLHAYRLEFDHPFAEELKLGKTKITATAGLPINWSKLLQLLS